MTLSDIINTKTSKSPGKSGEVRSILRIGKILIFFGTERNFFFINFERLFLDLEALILNVHIFLKFVRVFNTIVDKNWKMFS